MQEVGLGKVLERLAQDISIQSARARWLDMCLQTVAQCIGQDQKEEDEVQDQQNELC